MLLLTIAACGPFGDDDDDDATSTPAATATATESDATATESDATASETEADSTATGEASATDEGADSTPSAEATEGGSSDGTAVPEGTQQPLQPPQARLIVGDNSLDAAIGSYGWQFQDQMQSFIVSQSPLVTMTDNQMNVTQGTEVTFEIFGEFYDPSNPPPSLKLAIYDFSENSAIPLNTEGQATSDVPVFVKQTEPVQSSDLDPASPTFTLDVPPGMYAVEIVGDWGPHPKMDTRNIMVTWVFNVRVN